MTAMEGKPIGEPTEEDFIRFAIVLNSGRATGTSDSYEILHAMDGNQPRDIGQTPSILLAYRFFQTTNLRLALRATIKSSKLMTQNVQRMVVEANTAPSCGLGSGGLTSGCARSLSSPDTMKPGNAGSTTSSHEASKPLTIMGVQPMQPVGLVESTGRLPRGKNAVERISTSSEPLYRITTRSPYTFPT
jgi:hypothetical protein